MLNVDVKKIAVLSVFSALSLFTVNLYSSDILYFNQDCNVDAVGSDNTCFDERHNLLTAVTDLGHNVTLLDSFNASNLLSLLEDNDLLLIPDLEDQFVSCQVSDQGFLSNEAQTIIQNYVTAGGQVLVTGSSQNIELLNNLFGLGLTPAGNVSSGISVKNENDAAGTAFSSCPQTITNLDVTFLVTSSMPNSKRCIYEFGNSTSMALFDIGSGTVGYIGFDFYDAGIGCTNDGSEWIDCVLPQSIDALTSVPIPALSEWGIIILLLMTLILGFVVLKNPHLVRI